MALVNYLHTYLGCNIILIYLILILNRIYFLTSYNLVSEKLA